MPGTKDYVSLGKKVYKQKRLMLCNLNELYTAFKEKHPNSKIGPLSFVDFDLSGVLLLWKSKTRVTSYEFESTSYVFKSTRYELKFMSYELKFTSYEFQFTSYEFQFTSYEFQSTSYEFKLASKNTKSTSWETKSTN